jgi:hypothetical protein
MELSTVSNLIARQKQAAASSPQTTFAHLNGLGSALKTTDKFSGMVKPGKLIKLLPLITLIAGETKGIATG